MNSLQESAQTSDCYNHHMSSKCANVVSTTVAVLQPMPVWVCRDARWSSLFLYCVTDATARPMLLSASAKFLQLCRAHFAGHVPMRESSP